MMKLLRASQILFKNTPKYRFSSTSTKDHHEQHEQPVITKHNPTGQYDLRGHEHQESLTQVQKSYSPLHNSSTSSIFSLHKLCSFLPNRFAKSLGNIVPNPAQSIASDNLNLPKIVPGGIAVYDSINFAPVYSVMNQLMVIVVPLTSVIFGHDPVMSVFSLTVLGYAYYQLRWKMAKDIVVRLQLSPHTEELYYQKLSVFGTLQTSKVSIHDLQHVTFDQLFGQNDPSQRSTRGLCNPEVAFRHKVTNQLLFFDINGIWNEEGINHPLMV